MGTALGKGRRGAGVPRSVATPHSSGWPRRHLPRTVGYTVELKTPGAETRETLLALPETVGSPPTSWSSTGPGRPCRTTPEGILPTGVPALGTPWNQVTCHPCCHLLFSHPFLPLALTSLGATSS